MLEVESLTRNLNRVALAILALLEGEVPHHKDWPDDFEETFKIETSTFYNGRENGICLTVKDYHPRRSGKWLAITFGENRNSDSIFVAHWTQPVDINPPTLRDLTDEAYESRRYLAYNEIYEAADYIRELIINHCDSILPRAE